MIKTTKMIYMSLLVAMALVLQLVERSIPVPFITPGAKLGLSNLIIVIALYTLKSKRDVFKINIVRLILGAMVGGNLTSFIYSVSGVLFSFFAMVIVKKLGKDKVSIIGVSASGAVFHNIGQLIVASAVVQNWGVTLYLPVLSIAGIGTGIFIGITANYITTHMYRLPFFKNS